MHVFTLCKMRFQSRCVVFILISIGMFLTNMFYIYLKSATVTFKGWQHRHLYRDGTCSKIWWPNTPKQLGPQINITPVSVIGDGCDKSHYHDSIRLPLKKKLGKYRQYIYKLQRQSFPAIFPWNIKRNTTRFQQIDFTGGYVISAFLDSRDEQMLVKILYIMPVEKNILYCQAFCKGQYSYVRGNSHQIRSTEFSKRCLWDQYILVCHFKNCKVSTVSVTSSHCLRPTNTLEVFHIRHEVESPKLLGACLNTIYNSKKDDLPFLVNYFESFLHFGGDVVYLYGTYDVEPEVMNVLHYYEKRGVLKIYDWQVPDDVGSLYTNGHYIINMDCTYRHMHEVRYLIFTDYDEVLYPLIHKNYGDLLHYLFKEQYAALIIERYLISPDFLFERHRNRITVKDICYQVYPKPLGRPKHIFVMDSHFVTSAVQPFNVPQLSVNNITVILHFRSNYPCFKSDEKEAYIRKICNVVQKLLPKVIKRSDIILNSFEND